MSTPGPASHPSASLLAAYASGWISWSGDLCVRVHLETCAVCREAVQGLEIAEADFVDALPEAPIAPDAVRDLVAKLEATPVEAGLPRKRAMLGDVPLPQALDSTAIGRRRWLGPGFWIAPIKGGHSQGWRTYVLRAPAGLRLPRHGHAGPELTCVLAGAFDERRRYGAGDFLENDGVSEHSLSVARDGPCACLIAHRGRLRWRGAAKVLGPMLSI